MLLLISHPSSTLSFSSLFNLMFLTLCYPLLSLKMIKSSKNESCEYSASFRIEECLMSVESNRFILSGKFKTKYLCVLAVDLSVLRSTLIASFSSIVYLITSITNVANLSYLLPSSFIAANNISYEVSVSNIISNGLILGRLLVVEVSVVY